jgi:hypothetical protein
MSDPASKGLLLDPDASDIGSGAALGTPGASVDHSATYVVDVARPGLAAVVGESAVVAVQTGVVFIETPSGAHMTLNANAAHAARWRELGNRQKIPMGSRVDTRRGSITMRTAKDKVGHQQTAVFKGGVFSMTQRPANGATVELRLDQKLGPCPKHAKASAAVHSKKNKKNGLNGNGKGKYKTRGQYATATVVGTHWITEDSCAGTRVTVLEGIVKVRSVRTGKIVNVRAGHSILVRRP